MEILIFDNGAFLIWWDCSANNICFELVLYVIGCSIYIDELF